MSDLKETLEQGRFRTFGVFLAGNASTGDYLGDSTNDEGVPLGAGEVESVSLTSQTADATGLEVTVHNVTRGTSEVVTFASSTYDQQDVDLHFGEGDEVAVEVTAVDGTTPAADTQLTFSHEVSLAPMR